MGFDPEKITYFAETDARGQHVKFGIKAKDRQRHMYVIGKTGMGKSTLLENMAAQDIMNGEGMAFIDPHGSAIETLLEYVPEHRLDDVVYFAPFDMENPISFNMMEDVGADTRHLVVSGLMSTFKKIWEDAWSARMEYILTNALLALIEYPDTTLLSVNRMLADKAYRDKVIDHCQDPAVKAYWLDEFNNYTERFAAEALPAIQNKIGQFTGNPLIRNIIGQPKSSFDVRKMMDEKKILFINLSKGLVGETNADLLGSMLITQVYLAAMSRADLPPAKMKQMPNFYFYVDEFQSFANSTFANILSEARKYHLNLIIAHQYVEQMEEAVRDAVFGNVGTTITFRVGPFDAEVLERIFEPKFEAIDLVNIGPFQIYLTLMIDGAGSPPFSAATLPPVETPPVSFRDMVIARSRQNYTQPREVAEKLVNDLHTPEDRAEATAKGEGGNKGGFSTPKFGAKVGQGNGKGGNGKKERPKPDFGNTILDKLREQQEPAEKKSDSVGKTETKENLKELVKPKAESKPVQKPQPKPELKTTPASERKIESKESAPKKEKSRADSRDDTKQQLSAMVAKMKQGVSRPQAAQSDNRNTKSVSVPGKESRMSAAEVSNKGIDNEKVKAPPVKEVSVSSERRNFEKPEKRSQSVVLSSDEKTQPDTTVPDLSQLRSVLAKISADDRESEKKKGNSRRNGRGDRNKRDQKNRKPEQHNNTNNQRQQRRPEKKTEPDLKSALSAALSSSGASVSKETTKQVPKTEVKKEERDEKGPVTASEKKSNHQSHKSPHAHESAAPETKNSGDVSPKELERMMRVTTSDKPPLQ